VQIEDEYDNSIDVGQNYIIKFEVNWYEKNIFVYTSPHIIYVSF
jgi:hypothetical protein